ncbi:MAG TPA: c-type cytochrome [Candidatus Sulfotelmatobacter sp.]|nr:c-type cytochrome [Candidatus Sulfotelmatobacter sp.]
MTLLLAAILATATPAPDAAGALAYAQHCSSCHGADLHGGLGGPPLVGVGAATVDFMLQTGRMPAADPNVEIGDRRVQLPPATIAHIEAYIAAVAPGGPAIPQVVIGDATRGRTLFEQNCEHCHGVAAEGAPLGGDYWAPNLHHTSITQVAEAIRIGPDEMPPFTTQQLSDADLNDVAAYVFQLATDSNTPHVPAATSGPVPEGLIGWLAIAALSALAFAFSRETSPDS